jgi:hypothetical protein
VVEQAKVQYGVFIKIGELHVHPVVQRRFDPVHAKKILSDFDVEAFGQLKVVKDGKQYLVFDGQHRLWAAREYLGGEQRVPCEVHDHISVSRQAELFILGNRGKAPKAIDTFLMHVRAGHEIETGMSKLLGRHQLRVDYGATEGTLRAVLALRTIYTRYGEAITDRTLGVLRCAWGLDPDAYAASFITGVGLLIHRFADRIEDKDLAVKMSKASGPAKFIGGARDRAKTMHMTMARSMAEVLLNLYNKGRRKNALSL